MVHTVTENNFEQLVESSEGTVLLDFWAGWCGPCRMMSPVVEQIAQERGDVTVGKVNVDEEGGLGTAGTSPLCPRAEARRCACGASPRKMPRTLRT